jgi:hypothetical protein
MRPTPRPRLKPLLSRAKRQNRNWQANHKKAGNRRHARAEDLSKPKPARKPQRLYRAPLGIPRAVLDGAYQWAYGANPVQVPPWEVVPCSFLFIPYPRGVPASVVRSERYLGGIARVVLRDGRGRRYHASLRHPAHHPAKLYDGGLLVEHPRSCRVAMYDPPTEYDESAPLIDGEDALDPWDQYTREPFSPLWNDVRGR